MRDSLNEALKPLGTIGKGTNFLLIVGVVTILVVVFLIGGLFFGGLGTATYFRGQPAPSVQAQPNLAQQQVSLTPPYGPPLESKVPKQPFVSNYSPPVLQQRGIVAVDGPSGGCASPQGGETTYWRPLSLRTGSCVTLDPADRWGMYFWAQFSDVPSRMEGVAEFASTRETVGRDGQPDLEPTERCTGHCFDFVRRNLSKPVFVRQTVGQRLFIEF